MEISLNSLEERVLPKFQGNLILFHEAAGVQRKLLGLGSSEIGLSHLKGVMLKKHKRNNIALWLIAWELEPHCLGSTLELVTYLLVSQFPHL